MNLDDNTIAEIAKQLGIGEDKTQTVARAKAMSMGLDKKSDEELVADIIKMRDQLIGSNVPKQKQIDAVKSLMPLMNGPQKTRLAKLIELLESN